VYDFLFVIIELFSLAVTAETLQAEICRRERFLKGVSHFDRPFQVESDIAHQPLLGGRKVEDCPFMWYKNIAGRFFGLVTKHAYDRRTDRRTELRLQDRASIAASRGN